MEVIWIAIDLNGHLEVTVAQQGHFGIKLTLRSLDFVVVRFLMKLFKTVNNEIIRKCCSYFKFTLPKELLNNQRVKFQNNFMLCTGILYYFGIKI